MKPRRWLVYAAGALATGMLSAPSAHAIGFRSAYITSWSGCECSANSLSYTDDQINYFNERMTAKGNNRLSTFANTSVWGSDIGEDRDIGGQDFLYSDDAQAWAYSGHGAQYVDGSGIQHYWVPFCMKGASSFAGSCAVDSNNHVRLGEQSPTYYSSAHSGQNRYLVLATCYSVDSSPHQQWGATLGYGTEYIMGYRGTSADSSTTDEVLGDWVDNAYAGTVYTFKSSWFNAIEDWWVDDTGAVVSGGVTEADAIWRRDNYSRADARRAPLTWWSWLAWSWHEG